MGLHATIALESRGSPMEELVAIKVAVRSD
jgi:hypothetical protein